MAETGRSAQAVVIQELGLVLRPLRGLQTPASATALVRRLGWDFPAADPFPGVPTSLATKLGAMRTSLSNVRKATDDADRFAKSVTLLGDVRGVLTVVSGMGPQMRSALTSSHQGFKDNSGIETELARRLLDHLISEYVRGRSRAAYDLGVLLGLFEPVLQEADPQSFRLPTVYHRIHWERVPKLLSDPIQVMDQAYGWSSGFKPDLFLSRLFALFLDVGLPVCVVPQPERIADVLQRPLDDRDEHRLSVVRSGGATAFTEAGLSFSAVPGDGNLGSGIAVVPWASGSTTVQQKLTETLGLAFSTSLGLAGGAVFVLRPPRRVSVAVNLLTTPKLDVTGTLGAELTRKAPPGRPFLIVGDPEATRMTLGELTVGLAASAKGTQERELAFSFDVKQLAVVVKPGDGDGFLQKVLPPDGINAAADLGVVVSSATGLRFKDGGGLEVTVPVNLSLAGVVRLDSVFVRLAVQGSTLRAVVAVTGGVKLGPIAATVERMGIAGTYGAPASGQGNLGAASTGLAFEPPKGVGLKVGAGPVGGGGYLFFDPEAEQYAGALQLDFKALSLKAVGLLTTRMPDGSKGFSLLVIITAEFPPIQLSFGFTLNGVGGLVGINRSANRPALEAGLKDGSLDSVRFPKNVVENAPKIISDLRNMFPVTPGQHVFGPMVALGWGTPPIVRLELGLLLELPSPLRLHLLGRVSAALPAQEAPLVLLQLDIYGYIDFDAAEAALMGTLRDSRILDFPLTGELAGKVTWGPSPMFAASAGGFHPRAPLPPGFPTLERMALSLAAGDNPRLRLECYVAMTANTRQFGAHLDLFAETDLGLLGRFTVQGFLTFDVLARPADFEFLAELRAGLTIKRNGSAFCNVALELNLSGVIPIHAWGQATFEAFGFKRSIPIDETFGPTLPPPPPSPVDPEPLLLADLKVPGNWSASLPGDDRMLVTLRSREAGETALLVHPLGALTIRQRVAPFRLTLERFGNHPLADGAVRRYTLTATDDSAGKPLDASPVRDPFAPGEFLELSEDQRLSRPSFEPMESGVQVSAPGAAVGSTRTKQRGYKTVIAEPGQEAKDTQEQYTVPESTLLKLAQAGAAARSDLRANGELAFRGARKAGVRVAEPSYVVVRTSDMGLVGTQAPSSYAEAEQQRAAGGQVVPSHEAVA